MQFTDQVYEKYNSYTSLQKSYFNIILTLGLLILLIILIYPAIGHILTLQKETKDGRIILKSLQEKIASLDQAEKNFNDLKDELAILDQALPYGSGLKDYIKRPLEALASENQMSINSLQFNEVPLSPPKTDEAVKARSLSFTFVVSGNFVDFNKFLTNIELFIRTTQIDSVQIASNQNGRITANVKATTHYLGQSITSSLGQNQNQTKD